MNDNTPLLTIGIPSFNGGDYLHQLLASIEKELTGISYEVIVVDDGSSDGTSEKIPMEFPWIQFLHTDKNRGVSLATQDILTNMRGKLLLRLDADTLINRQSVVQMIDLMETRPEIGALAPRLVDEAGNYQPSYETHFKKPWEWFMDYFLWGKKLLQKKDAKQENVSTEPREVAYVASAAVMIRTELARQVGGLDPQMEFFMEDADWLLRISQTGHAVIYWPAVSVVHIGGHSGALYIHTRNRSLQNLYYFYQKHQPGQMTQLSLMIAILSGSALSLTAAFLAFPAIYLRPQLKSIVYRSIVSFSNVWRWHIQGLGRLLRHSDGKK